MTLISGLLLAVSLYVVIIFKDLFGSGVVGLILTYALPLPEILCETLFNIATLENTMVSVERCHRFTAVQSEKYEPESGELSSLRGED